MITSHTLSNIQICLFLNNIVTSTNKHENNNNETIGNGNEYKVIRLDIFLTHTSRMEFSILINRISSFPFGGLLGAILLQILFEHSFRNSVDHVFIPQKGHYAYMG